ncbi:MAG: hypothetical protein ABSH34_29500 [Verrucomicrobiota bacterium]
MAGEFAVMEKLAKLIFVLLDYSRFDDLQTHPGVWVIPAEVATQIKRPWLGDTFAVYCGNKAQRLALEPYRDAWKLYFK